MNAMEVAEEEDESEAKNITRKKKNLANFLY
jgi:hypothetical protein